MSSKRTRAARPLGAEIQQEDAFLAGVMQTTDWARRNREKLILGIIALALIILAPIYLASNRQRSANLAAAALERAQQTMQLGNIEAAKGELEGFLAQFGGTSHEAEARLLLGHLHLESGDANAAITVLEPVGSSPNSQLGLQAAALLAAAFEEAGQTENAVATYLEIVERSDMTFQIREALLDAARMMTATGDITGAVGAYREALDLLEDADPRRGMIEMRISELSAANPS